jgi:hypothetical protein
MAGYKTVMPATTQAVAATDETFTGDAVDVSDCRHLTCVFKKGTATATVTRLDAWLQGSLDGANWFDLMHDGALLSTGTAADITANAAGKRNIFDNNSTLTPQIAAAKYTNLAVPWVRAKAIMDVSTSGVWSEVTGFIYGVA